MIQNNSQPLIDLQKISKIFDKGKPKEIVALQDISLQIMPRTTTVLRGASGSGKSTLLSIIACLSKPTEGEYLFLGNRVTHWSEKFLTKVRQEHVGIIFQQFQLLPDLTIFQNIALPLLALSYSHKTITQKVLPLADKLGLSHRLFSKAYSLSGGEMQRTAIARALVQNPTLIIADEPTAHLDTQRSVQILNILNELKQEGKTIVLTTHDDRVEQFLNIDLCLEMQDGKFV